LSEQAINHAAAAAFTSLRAKAGVEHAGNTQRLLVVYAVEPFLRRLALSDYSERMVLKGGMLMAASGVRRITRDADLSTHGVANDADRVREIIADICALTPEPHDGIVIDPAGIRSEVMREGDEYRWADLITDVIAFVDPLLTDAQGAPSRWDCASVSWI
jgi:hypothetical protein